MNQKSMENTQRSGEEPAKAGAVLPFTIGVLPLFLFVAASLLLVPALPIALFESLQHPLSHFCYFLHLLFFITAACMAFFSLAWFTLNSGIPAVIMFIVVLISCAISVMTAALPPTLPESLFFLQVVKGWAYQPYLEYLSWMDYAFHPLLPALGLSTLYLHGVSALVPLYQAGELLILCATVLYFLDNYRSPSELTAAAVIMIATTPLFLFMGGALSPLLSYCIYATIAFVSIIFWAQREKTFFHLLLASFALGLLASSAYQGFLLASIMLLLMFFPLILPERRAGQLIIGIAFAFCIAPALAAPWYVKNMLLRSNPVYPLFMDSDEDVRPTLRVRGAAFSLITDENRELRSASELGNHAVRLLSGGRSDLSYLGIDARFTPLYLTALFSLLLIPLSTWPLYVMICAAFMYFGVALVAVPAIQVFIPFFPIFAVMSALGIHRVLSFFPIPAGAISLAIICLVQTFVYLPVVATALTSQTTRLWFKGAMEKNDYLRSQIQEFPVIEHVNSTVPLDARVMLVFMGDYYYYYERKIVSEGGKSDAYLTYVLQSATDARALSRQFFYSGIHYIVASEEKLLKTLPASAAVMWNSFQTLYLEPEFRHEGYVVWKVRNPENPLSASDSPVVEEEKE